MRVLLDTHVFLWMHAAPERLSKRTRGLLIDDDTELLLSCVVPWELGIKVAQGKLRLPAPVEEYCASRARAARMRLLDVRFVHVYEASRLPLHHRDPFDRMLIAQARIEALPVLTADRAFRDYDVEVTLA
ncbi:MAG: type II toxin-antitoxin system VapC family toxin [Myxococcota bacterium]|nr:type II toxin-antitoxin system VapC family toxin [Myxococcota bacterium]